MNTEKILEQLHYFNIHADIDSVSENWIVTKKGDVVNSVFPYAILAIHFKDKDWLSHLRTKAWFRPECEESLKKALVRASEIIK